MIYNKPPLSFEDQADQLLQRGLIADRDLLISRLQSVNYYRLSGYWYPLRNQDHSFQENTSLDTIWRRYTFDRHLRVYVLDAIERVEIAIRTDITYQMAHTFGPFGYSKSTNLPNLTPEDHAKLISQLRDEYSRSKEVFATHFHGKYGDEHDILPIWMITELMTFGSLLTFFRGIPTSVKQKIAKKYGVADRVLESWLRSLNAIRNTCAHHARLWNKELGYRPMIPRRGSQWKTPVEVRDNRVFCILTILKYFLNQIAPQSNWTNRINHLLEEYPEIPRLPMGFDENWQDCPIWNPKKG